MKAQWTAIGLGILGLAQITGDVLDITPLRGLAAATTASPAPKVFSAVRGLETYSSSFFIEWQDANRADQSLELTPEVYARLKGPYNRRNAYGAVIAYGPILAADPTTQDLLESVARYALCGRAPVLRELGIEPSAVNGAVRVRIEPISTSRHENLPLVFEAPCSPRDSQ
jgi:hypothetical protein